MDLAMVHDEKLARVWDIRSTTSNLSYRTTIDHNSPLDIMDGGR
jgi:hypothetical protein